MLSVFWIIFGLICKGFAFLILITIVYFMVKCIWSAIINDGRKWHYYNPSKPWKGGYWEPVLPKYPPYNEYKWNPDSCRFEHKKTGEPLYSWQKPAKIHDDDTIFYGQDAYAAPTPRDKSNTSHSRSKKKLPNWIRFLFEETPASLLEKRRQRKLAEKQAHENNTSR